MPRNADNPKPILPLDIRNEAIRRVIAGERETLVAQSMGINVQVVHGWVWRSQRQALAQQRASVKAEFSAKILEYLRDGLESLRVQGKLLGDRAFLTSDKGQVAAVAQAHRLMGDTLGRYLAALQLDTPSNDDEDEEAEGSGAKQLE